MLGIAIYKFDENIGKLQSLASILMNVHQSTKDNPSETFDENTTYTIMLQVATTCHNKLNIQGTFNHTLYKFSDMTLCIKSVFGFTTDIVICIMINSNNTSDISELINLTNRIVSDIQRDKDDLFYTSYQEMLDSNIQIYKSFLQNNPIKCIRNSTMETKSNMQSNILTLERQGEKLKNIERSSTNVANESSSILDKVKKINIKFDCNMI